MVTYFHYLYNICLYILTIIICNIFSLYCNNLLYLDMVVGSSVSCLQDNQVLQSTDSSPATSPYYNFTSDILGELHEDASTLSEISSVDTQSLRTFSPSDSLISSSKVSLLLDQTKWKGIKYNFLLITQLHSEMAFITVYESVFLELLQKHGGKTPLKVFMK